MQHRQIILIAICFLVGALLGVALLALNNAPVHRVETIGEAAIGGPFTLVDQAGKTVTDQDFRGKNMLVFFGFTHCPDVCPAELQTMTGALDKLGPKAKEVVPVFITVDPARDTPEVVADYVKNFGSNIVGLTGSKEQIDKVTQEYRVYAKIVPEADGKDYTVDHSVFAYLMGKDGKYITHFPYGTSVDDLFAALDRYL